ncbi:4812_t:CDS:2 [Entrophospora sp. SA101]|nr:4812_t:CDS:2 [Entrophospora sp. SA101]
MTFFFRQSSISAINCQNRFISLTKEELLKKRQKLEELRRAREERIKSTPASKKEDFNQFLDDILSVKSKPTTEPTKDITPNITAPYINPPVVQSPSLVNPRYIPGFNTTETVLLDVPPRVFF